MHLDGQDIVARPQAAGGKIKRSFQGRVPDRSCGESVVTNRTAVCHAYAEDFLSVEVKNRAVVDDCVQLQHRSRNVAAEVKVPAEIVGQRPKRDRRVFRRWERIDFRVEQRRA